MLAARAFRRDRSNPLPAGLAKSRGAKITSYAAHRDDESRFALAPTLALFPFPPSELRRTQRRQPVGHASRPWAIAPLRKRDFARAADVGVDHFGHVRGERTVGDVEVGFVVELEGAVVEVGRAADRQIAVHHHQFVVEQRRLELEEARARLHEYAPGLP